MLAAVTALAPLAAATALDLAPEGGPVTLKAANAPNLPIFGQSISATCVSTTTGGGASVETACASGGGSGGGGGGST